MVRLRLAVSKLAAAPYAIHWAVPVSAVWLTTANMELPVSHAMLNAMRKEQQQCLRQHILEHALIVILLARFTPVMVIKTVPAAMTVFLKQVMLQQTAVRHAILWAVPVSAAL
jgi:hypothetical protein